MHLTFVPPANARQPSIKELNEQAEREATIAKAVQVAEEEREQRRIERFARMAREISAQLDRMRSLQLASDDT